MLWEKKLAQWSAAVRARANLPARLTLWDGQSYDFGTFSGPSVTLHVKSPAALALMLQPTLDNLGEAYVKSKIDIEGKLSDVIDIAYGLAKTSIDKPGGALQNMARYFAHTRSSDRKSIEYHYDVSNAFYSEFLDPNMVYSCAYFENGDEDLATAQPRRSTTS
jgi:cyclopropane-fatty-acyl-phospholipid synthase